MYLQPKNLPEVLEPLSKIPVDKLYLRYFPYPVVYQLAYDFIRDHPEYTHIFWLQNDIILHNEDFVKMCYTLGSNPDFDILGCTMNVDLDKHDHNLAFTTTPFDITSKKEIDWPVRGFYQGMVKVFHNGGPFLIKRELYLIFPLRGEKKTGLNADIYFGKSLYDEGIPYFVDTGIELKHLRYKGEMLVNRKEPQMEFKRWT